jgi:hypothetical protein
MSILFASNLAVPSTLSVADTSYNTRSWPVGEVVGITLVTGTLRLGAMVSVGPAGEVVFLTVTINDACAVLFTASAAKHCTRRLSTGRKY